jgi:hypothetical protein
MHTPPPGRLPRFHLLFLDVTNQTNGSCQARNTNYDGLHYTVLSDWNEKHLPFLLPDSNRRKNQDILLRHGKKISAA